MNRPLCLLLFVVLNLNATGVGAYVYSVNTLSTWETTSMIFGQVALDLENFDIESDVYTVSGTATSDVYPLLFGFDLAFSPDIEWQFEPTSLSMENISLGGGAAGIVLSVAPVPVPAAAWLFGCAVMLLGSVRRWRTGARK